jgi:hypothetical protein
LGQSLTEFSVETHPRADALSRREARHFLCQKVLDLTAQRLGLLGQVSDSQCSKQIRHSGSSLYLRQVHVFR